MEFKTGFNESYLSFFRFGNPHWLLALKPFFYGSGRAAFVDIAQYYVKKHGELTVLMPNFQCFELVDALAKIPNLKIVFYPVMDDLLPDQTALSQLILSSQSNSQSNSQNKKFLTILVDYFASVNAAKLWDIGISLNTFVAFDCVHSFPTRLFSLADIPPQISLIFGYRKLFWKFFGAVVIRNNESPLPLWPRLIAKASPNFPRNLTLTPRFGWLGRILIRFFNWHAHEQVARAWAKRPIADAAVNSSILSSFNCPVQLIETQRLSFGQSLGHWPDLSEKMPIPLYNKAKVLKENHHVISKAILKVACDATTELPLKN